MPVRPTTQMRGYAGITFKTTSTNTARAFVGDDSVAMTNDNDGCVGALITCETNPIRYSFGTVPAQATPLGHVLAAGVLLELTNPVNVRALRYISGSANNHANMQVTLLYSYPPKN